MKHYVVTAAIIINKDQVFCAQRGKGKFDYISYKYEFPGGKVEEGETNEESLSRELSEEMSIDICIHKENYFMTVDHTYPDFSIKMHSYLVHIENRDLNLNEHHHSVWLSFDQLHQLDWAEADIPIVNELIKKTQSDWRQE